MDPVSEIQALLRGDPVQAYPDQLHEAYYLQHYAAFMNNPQFGAHPEVQKQIGPTAMALIGQRLGYAWAAANRALGVPAPMLPPQMQPEGAPPAQPGPAPGEMGPQAGMPPQQQLGPEQIAMMAAQVAPQLASAQGLPLPPSPSGQDGGLHPDVEAHFRDRETTALENESAAKVQSTQADTAAKARIADIKAQQEQEKLNQTAQETELRNQREARLQQQDDAHVQNAHAEIAAKGEALQQSREQHAVDLAHKDEAHQTQQQMEQIKGAIETAALARETQNENKQAALDQAEDLSGRQADPGQDPAGC
jgi:flagellar biosynthesis GTPase FlhF